MVSCVKDFYIPPRLKTLAGVVFKRRQCRQVMERLESASTKNFLTNAEMVYHFRRAFWCCWGGGGGWGGRMGGWWGGGWGAGGGGGVGGGVVGGGVITSPGRVT